MSQSRRKSTQRERLLEGMLKAAVQEGYTGATVARVIANAEVSRPTFYEYFADRQACFAAVHRELTTGLLERIGSAIEAADRSRALEVAVAELVKLARAEPVAARFLLHEAAVADRSALDERDRTIAAIALLVERARAQAPLSTRMPDVYVPAVIGSIYRLLALRLRRGERDLSTLTGELETWLASYARPASEHRWGSLEDGSTPAVASSADSTSLSSDDSTSLYPPPPLPSGRQALSSEEVSYNHRERILFACVRMSNEKSYATCTIADITAAAHVDRRVFYQHFRDKQEAYQAALEHTFQQAIAVTATGFFGAPTWPERVWEAGRAFTQFLARNEAAARFAFIDAYTIGPTAMRRFEDLRLAYTIFLQEGRQQPQEGLPEPSEIALEAIAAVVFEIAYGEIRRDRMDRLEHLLPHVTHLCVTPFLGLEKTEAIIETKLAEHPAAP